MKGPVKNMDRNMQEVLRSFTCMYEQMEKLAKQQVAGIKRILDQIETILAKQREAVKAAMDLVVRTFSSSL